MTVDAPTDRTLAAVEVTTIDPDARSALGHGAGELGAGRVVGRYVLLTPLGSGAMGEVWAAYDPELARRVALKFLLPKYRAEHALREAQALAKLNHPNVVAIHDVGTWHERVWLGMEFVEGQTLTAWLAAGPRTWREILTVMQAAGRGMVAAHESGLVHGDFKPDNIMVGTDGRVRVMDFGLARARADVLSNSGVRRKIPEARTPVAAATQPTELSAARAPMEGTPAYMAPEQFAGLDGGPASDQFSYCVTLWEALFGDRPFRGKTLTQLSLAVLEGRIEDTPAAKVPSRIRRHITRGLANDVAERWPSMEALLEALAHDPRTSRRRTLVAATVVALLAGALGWHQVDRSRTIAACEAEGDSVRALWSDEVRASSRRAFAETGLVYAEDTWARADARMRTYVDEWAKLRTETCRQAEVHRERDAVSRGRIDTCLDERRAAVASLARVLTTSDTGVVRRAVSAVAELPLVSRCADERWVAGRVPPPDDPALRAHVAALRAGQMAVSVLETTGSEQGAVDELTKLRAQAETLGWDPLLAELDVALGDAYGKLGDYDQARVDLERGFSLAAISGHDAAAAEAASKLTYYEGNGAHAYEEALRWADLGAVFIARSRTTGGLTHASLLNARGIVERITGRPEAAIETLSEAVELWRAILGDEHPALSAGLNNLGASHFDLGQLDEAAGYYRRTLELREAVYGPDHPQVAVPLNNLGNIAHQRADYEAALAPYLRALAVREAALGPDHPATAFCLNNVGRALIDLGRVRTALAVLHRATDVRVRALGSDHPHLSTTLLNLGLAHHVLGDDELALALFERALAIREGAYGPDHGKTAAIVVRLAMTYEALGDAATATRLFARAVAMHERGGPLDAGDATTVARLAGAQLAAGDRQTARATFERASSILDDAGGPSPSQRAVVELVHAKLLWAEGDVDGAEAAAQSALTSARDGRRQRSFAAAEAWLRDRQATFDSGAP